MDYKKVKTDTLAVTRDIRKFDEKTGNIYESVVMLSRRANQISKEIKEELGRKIEEFATSSDTLEEAFENREQIEIAKFYESLPKPTLIAIHEYLNNQIHFRNPDKELSGSSF